MSKAILLSTTGAVAALAMLTAGLGIALIVHPQGGIGPESFHPSGLIAALAAAASYALTFLVIAKVKATDSANVLNLWCALAVLLLGMALSLGEPLPTDPRLVACGLLYGFCGLVGQTLIVWGTVRTTAASGSTAGVLIPVFATMIGFFALKQPVDAWEILGMLVVVVSAAVVARLERKGESKQA